MKLPRTCATARPQLAKADTAFQAHPLVNQVRPTTSATDHNRKSTGGLL